MTHVYKGHKEINSSIKMMELLKTSVLTQLGR